MPSAFGSSKGEETTNTSDNKTTTTTTTQRFIQCSVKRGYTGVTWACIFSFQRNYFTIARVRVRVRVDRQSNDKFRDRPHMIYDSS